MTDQQHPIIPPPELVEQWLNQVPKSLRGASHECWFATQAARWGADQELEACIDFVRRGPWCSKKLRAARRPKSPSLKELALAKLAAMERLWEASGNEPSDLVRRALELLDD